MEQSMVKSNKEEMLEKLNNSVEIVVVKKDGTKEPYNIEKVQNAILKAAERVSVKLTEDDITDLCVDVYCSVVSKKLDSITVQEMHNLVEASLAKFNTDVAESYRNYRNYKQDFVHMLDKVYQESQRIMYLGDKENSNVDSTLVSTKRSLVYNELSKELYKKFFLTVAERQAVKDGYIYVHDMSARLNCMNCCLADIGSILKDGFEMGNIWYNEPKSLDVAFDVIGDITMSMSAQQYGGFTIPEVDKILEPYAKKSHKIYYDELINLGVNPTKALEGASKKVERDFEQGFQGWEYKYNTVGSSRGDYPFLTVTSGLSTTTFGRMCNLAMLKVRMNGQGKKDNKKPVLFPKIVFLYDKDLHGEGKELHDIYLAGIECSKRAMYPDWLSLTGEGYVASMYKKHKRIVSPMGSVDGNETITIKTGDKIESATFNSLWNKLSKTCQVLKQTSAYSNKGRYIEPDNLQVWDTTSKGWVDVRFVTENICKEWCKVKLENGKELICTLDHPLQTNRGRVLVQDFEQGECVLCIEGGRQIARYVNEVEHISHDEFGYDLTTSSDKFDVSGICSHNCRAFLSPWYEEGGAKPANEEDKPVFVGRFNIGAVSLHLPMILAKSRQENKDFYEVLDYYMEMIRNLHKRTYDYLGEMRASTNPLAYCEGGFYGGNLGYNDKIKPILKSATASFGITALNELQRLYNGKSLVEDGQFALEVMNYINKKVAEFKEADGHLYALYGTPAENLCGLQIKQFRQKYGIIENVSDKLYVSNSFHCHVSEEIDPIQKQDLEKRFWDLMNGGKIQYVRYPIDYNTEAVKSLVERAMDLGFYEGVNLSLSYCDDCGHQELDMDACPKCGSRNLTKIDRMNGYLSYSRVKGDTRLNEAKMAEIAERRSM